MYIELQRHGKRAEIVEPALGPCALQIRTRTLLHGLRGLLLGASPLNRRLIASPLRRRFLILGEPPLDVGDSALLIGLTLLLLKLFSTEPVHLHDRQHFLAVAARQLRHIVVDYARSKHAQKRGGLQETISLDDAHGLAVPADSRVIELDEALGRLEAMDARAAQVVELRFFGGLTDEEVGKTLGISLATVKRDWDFARSWLLNQMT